MKKLIFMAMLIATVIPALSQKRITQVKSRADVLNEKYCSGLFDTPTGEYIDMEEGNNSNSVMGYLNILDWLRGRVASYQVYSTRTDVRIPYLRNQLAAVYVDEMRVSYDYLQLLSVNDIAMIKIIKGPFVGAWGAPGGTIAIYTFRGDEEEE